MSDLKDIKDKDITLALETALQSDEGVPASLIDVETKDGIAILSGSVQTIRAKERAGAIAETIKGVRSVVNQVAVKPVVRPDEEIYEDVSKALFFDPATHSYTLTISVEDGFVTLGGEVESHQKKELSEQVIKEVKGINAINNEIKIVPLTKRHDSEIEAEIKRRMALDVWLDEAFIDVAVKDGVVTLSGVVGSAVERTRAYLTAWVDGVTSVNSQALEVEVRERTEMRQPSKFALRTDEEIKWAIEGAFLYDPRLLGFNVKIEVEEGVVTLTGVVDNLQAKKAAEQDAGNTIGVWQVENHLKVRPVQPPDDLEIAGNVREALLWNPDIDRHKIVVSCHQGQVYLSGIVSSGYEKIQAEEVANRVRGVIEITNDLRVDQSWQWKSDEAIKRDIEKRFVWSPFVKADEITVSVKDGIARLSGVVDIWQERNYLVDQALKGGAKTVLSHLEVRYKTVDRNNAAEQ